MVNAYLVYGLVDPRSGELRYVGQTDHLLCQRLAQHEHAARRSKDRRMNTQWVRSLQAAGVRPEMFVLDRVFSKADADEAERHFIAYFRMVGARLNNHTDGGEGCVGYRHSPAARARIAAGKMGKGWSEERKLARRSLTPEQEVEVAEMYLSKGLSLHDVGARFGVSGAGVGKILDRLHVTKRVAVVGRWLTERRKAA